MKVGAVYYDSKLVLQVYPYQNETDAELLERVKAAILVTVVPKQSGRPTK